MRISIVWPLLAIFGVQLCYASGPKISELLERRHAAAVAFHDGIFLVHATDGPAMAFVRTDSSTTTRDWRSIEMGVPTCWKVIKPTSFQRSSKGRYAFEGANSALLLSVVARLSIKADPA